MSSRSYFVFSPDCGALPSILPHFPASICLDEPLWPKGPNLRKLTHLCVTTSVAAERARREQQQQGVSVEGPSSSPFDGPRGAELYRDLERVCRGPPLQVLHAVGLLALFPDMHGLARCSPLLPPSERRHLQQQQQQQQQGQQQQSPGWEYFTHVSALNQLLHLATQLQRDACIAANHKYLAHQIALLYQCLNQVKGESRPFKKRIEEQFEAGGH